MKNSFPLLIITLSMLACTPEKKSDSTLNVSSDSFGTMADGTAIDRFTVTNKNGIQMQAISYGGIMTSLMVPDREGNFEDIVLGFDSLEDYLEGSPYFGAIIGRYGNRIAKGKFSLDGQEYQLATNNIGNHLHGGNVGFDKVVWKAEVVEEENRAGIKFTYTSADGEEGYPGNLEVTVLYLLDNDNQLTFDYFARTDQKTIVNLTNHNYYNLTSMKDDILSHELRINAREYLPVDTTLIPLDPFPVEGTPFDFSTSKAIGRDIYQEHEQLSNGGGYDHCWILNQTDDELHPAAQVYEPTSGRLMEIFTTEPGIQFYSGNFLDGSISGKEGKVYEYRSGLCLETEHYPDSPNRSEFPSVVLNPGEEYRTKTVTRFSVK